MCGFRGVGKTSLVNRVLDDVAAPGNGRTTVAIQLSVARPIEPLELLSSMMRCLFEELSHEGILERLPVDLQERIWLCHARTSAAVGFMRNETSEFTRSTGVELTGKHRRSSIGLKSERSLKSAIARGLSMSFSAYRQADAEYDLIGIVKELSRTELKGRRWWQRFLRRADAPISILIVLDEMDKLTGSEEGLASLERLLVSLKTVLSTAGIHILCIAGVELIDEVRRDTARGNGIYESLFSWIEYVPCSWNCAAKYLESQNLDLRDPSEAFVLTSGIDFESRGNLRRLVQQVHQLVTWDGQGKPVVGFDVARLTFHAELNTLVEDFARAWSLTDRRTLAEDRLRLGAYLMCDWVLATQGAVFSPGQLIDGPNALSSSLRISRNQVERFLRHLADAGVIDLLWWPGVDHTVLAGVPPEWKFILNSDTRKRLKDLALADPDSWMSSEPDASTVRPLPRPATPMIEDPSVTRFQSSNSVSAPEFGRPIPGVAIHPGSILSGRWRVDEFVAAGGFSSVYGATDLLGEQNVVVKVVDDYSKIWDSAEWTSTAGVGQRLTAVRSAHVNRVLEGIRVSDSLALVLEKVEGVSLRKSMSVLTPSPSFVAQIARDVLEGISALHEGSLCNVDLKPENILISDVGGTSAVLIDVDLVSVFEGVGVAQQKRRRIGTPHYVAPEVFDGRPFGASADVYSFGVLLAELVLWAGRSRYPSPLSTPVPALLRLMPESTNAAVTEFLHRCVDEDPAKRYPSAREALAALPTHELVADSEVL